ncbi:MAG: hypothetical protein WBF67_04945 [Olleya sp.]
MKTINTCISSLTKTLLFSFMFLFSILSFAQSDIFEVSRNGSLEEIKSIYNQDKELVNSKN